MRIILTTLHSKFIHSCLALSCLASYCENLPDCEFVIQEYTVHEPKDGVLAAILSAGPDVVAFSVYIWNRRAVLDLADALAVAEPGLVIILGGPEVSFEGPEFFKTHPGITAIVRGEGEASFKEVLLRFAKGKDPAGTPGTLWHKSPDAIEGPIRSPLEELDSIPSPFESGLVDLTRGFVYLETSRGCPYRCLFCMSALEEKVRSFSMKRIRRDLDFLISKKVPKIKLVDRTFNYDPERAREIFFYILENNRESHFHFEVGANLLDEETIQLLRRVPEHMFQFEIGIQSCSPDTLQAVHRYVSLEKIFENVSRLRAETNIHLHLDLVAGLPHENYADFLASINRIAELQPQHLQIELVKLLPGSLLRKEACQAGIDYDPHPPYTVLKTRALSFADLSRLRGISRIVDMTYNSGHFHGFLEGLAMSLGSLACAFEKIESFWEMRNLFRNPMQRKDIFENMWLFVRNNFAGEEASFLTELLARDCARSERVVPGNAPLFFNTNLSSTEIAAVRELVREEILKVKGQGIKVQYFAAAFRRLPGLEKATVLVFFYLTGSGRKLEVKEIPLHAAS
jgi:radical SAM superfamily enzyme YgiQ (UPF0313 family)